MRGRGGSPERSGYRRSVLTRARVVAAAIVAALVVGLIGLAAPPAHARRAAKFTLTSPAFASGAEIPDGFTCTGASASPTLKWKNVPRKTVQLALIVQDPDARGRTFVHWVIWGLDPKAGQIVEETVPAGAVQGANSLGKPGYLGPCPPPGSAAHHYQFTLYALSQAPQVAAGATAATLRAAIKGHVLAKARLVGTFARPGGTT
jgi:Raf kinase inhibitor-like YbhB/YbcL family protein